MKIHTTYLDATRGEKHTDIELSASEFSEAAAAGRKIVEERGEFTEEEMAEISDIAYATLAVSDAQGEDAYSLACARYL